MYMESHNSEGATVRSLIRRVFHPLWICVVILGFSPVSVLSGALPSEGSSLAQIRLCAPTSEKERGYLGIGEVTTFSISQIDSPYTLIEIMSVYCPQCHEQAPLFNKLFYRIKKNSKFANKVKMMAVAIGANPTELREKRIPYTFSNN
jgi:hypothetical protein